MDGKIKFEEADTFHLISLFINPSFLNGLWH